MKKIFFAYVFCVFTCLLLCSCSKEKDVKVIGMSQCSGGSWRDRMDDEMRREVLFHPDIQLEFRYAKDDVTKQKEDILYFVEKGVDLLVVSPIDATSLTDVIAQAYDAGIPVIVADRLVEGDKYTASVAGDNEMIGHLMADFAMEHLPKGGKVVEITGLDGSSPVELRHKGLENGLAENKDVEIVATVSGNWNKQDVQKGMEEVLRLHPDVDVILAQNDAMANDAREMTMKLIPDNKILFMGVDGLPLDTLGIELIENGRLDATAVYPTGGSTIIQTAVKILNGEPYERNIVLDTYLVSSAKQAKIINAMARAEKHEEETIKMLKGRVDYYWELYSLQQTLTWTLVACLSLFLGCIAMLLRLNSFKAKANQRLTEQHHTLEQQKFQLLDLTEQLKAASQAKLSFFTGVSHDFRTPLTLISGPVASLAMDENLNDKQKLLVQIIEKNTRVLLRLINQVLDFRKFETGKLELVQAVANLEVVEKEWFGAFLDLAGKRNIRLTNSVEDGNYEMVCDVQKMERIFFNLMGNAFKFTPRGGRIDVGMKKEKGCLVLTIADSGPGISDVEKGRIFEDFYQVDAIAGAGSGIGLAVVKSFVELHGGTIEVLDAATGIGTMMKVTIPITNNVADVEVYSSMAIDSTSMAHINAEVLSTKNAETELSEIDASETVSEDEDKNVLLVIDDNTDILTFLRSEFEDSYRVITASDGLSGLKKAAQIVPDIIVSDLMMPGMDGLECCKKLRANLATSHIPVVMLTACSMDEDRVRSHKDGADAYISKPFSMDVLKAQVDVLIRNRQIVLSTIEETVQETPKQTEKTPGESVTSRREAVLNALDEEFLEKLRQRVNRNISNTGYGVELLAEDMGLSRSQLFRKLKAMTGITPNDYIKTARIEKAHELLKVSKYDIATIAKMTGFGSPSYFSKCYKECYGMLPNEVHN